MMEVLSPVESADHADGHNVKKIRNRKSDKQTERRTTQKRFLISMREALKDCGTCLPYKSRREALHAALFTISELQRKDEILGRLLTKEAARNQSLKKRLLFLRQQGEATSSESPLAELEATDAGIKITEGQDGGWISQHAEKFGMKEEDFLRNQLIEMESRTLVQEMEELQKIWRKKLKELRSQEKKSKGRSVSSNQIIRSAGTFTCESAQDNRLGQTETTSPLCLEQDAHHHDGNYDGEEGDGWISKGADKVKVKEEPYEEFEAVDAADVMHPVSVATNLMEGESNAIVKKEEGGGMVKEEEEDDFDPIPCLLCSRVFRNAEGLKHHLPTHAHEASSTCMSSDGMNSTSERAPEGGTSSGGTGTASAHNTGTASQKKSTAGQQKSTAGQQKRRPKEMDSVHCLGGSVFCCTPCNFHCHKFFKTHALTRASDSASSGNFCCNTCQKDFMTVTTLLDHVYEKHPFICAQCQTSSSLDGLVTAEEVPSLKRWQECFQDLLKGIPSHKHAYFCRYCGLPFKKSKHLLSHVKSHRRGHLSAPGNVAIQRKDLFSCHLCSRDDSQTSVERSRETSNLGASRPQDARREEKKKESSTSGGRKVSSRAYKHNKSVYILKGTANHKDAQKGREFCPLCPFTFARYKSVKHHLRTVHRSTAYLQHAPENSHRLLCNICGRPVTGLLSLQEHMRKAHPSHAP